MKIGGLVKRINTPDLSSLQLFVGYGFASAPFIEGFEGVIRSFDARSGIRFEGIYLPDGPDGVEFSYDIINYRVIEFPPALTESIQECLTRELEVVK